MNRLVKAIGVLVCCKVTGYMIDKVCDAIKHAKQPDSNTVIIIVEKDK